MQTKEFQLQTEEQMERFAKAKQELIDMFPTRQQRRAEERRRAKAATKNKIKPNRKIDVGHIY